MEIGNVTMWDQKRYHSLDFELKKLYGRKIYKLSLDGGMTCPNRDGTLEDRGCIFCSEGGSGEFAEKTCGSITAQIEAAKLRVAEKLSGPEKAGYIAYFQSYTNTYAPVRYLREIFTQAMAHPDIVILSIATRPDCIDDEVLSLLVELNRIKPVWIELGLQTIHEATARFIRRGYSLPVFEDCVAKLALAGIPVIVHTILGLPKESKHDMLKTVEYISRLPVQGIKLQLLHILKGTDLGQFYEEGAFTKVLSPEEYVDLVVSCIELLPGDMVIHRITGDGPKKLLLAPLWSRNKKLVLNSIHQRMKALDTWQGKRYSAIVRRRSTMQSDTFMLYKLIILHILSRVNFPLTNAQLTAFILKKEYTNYFNIQRAISELTDDAYITTNTIRNSTLYRITESGRETLQLFDNKIASGIKEDIETYLTQNRYELQEEVSSPAEFFQMKKGEYSVHLRVIERETSLIDLSLIVTTEEEASLMCNNWRDNSSDIYAYLMTSLLESK